jgi:hypothetical protein
MKEWREHVRVHNLRSHLPEQRSESNVKAWVSKAPPTKYCEFYLFLL